VLRLCGMRCRERCSEPPGPISSSLEFWGFFRYQNDRFDGLERVRRGE